MEIKSTLNKPYTENERINFIVQQNHQNGYQIKETTEALEAWGYTQEEIDKQEHKRIQELSMTRSDFFDGTIKAFGLGQDELQVAIEAVLTNLPLDEVTKKVALNNYRNALNFYRKHDLFSLLSGVQIPVGSEYIVITAEQWDKFFDETNKGNAEAWKALLPVVEEQILDEEL